MRSYIGDGEVLDYLNSSGSTILADQVVDLGFGFGVAQADILDGETGALVIRGIVKKAKHTSQAWTFGQVLYWDASPGEFTTVAATNKRAGVVAKAAASADTEGECLLIPGIDDDPGQLSAAAYVAPVSTANATDLASSEALANQLKTSVNAILSAMVAAGLMASS